MINLFRPGVFVLAAFLCLSAVAQAKEKYTLGIAPVLDYEDTMKTYQPLVEYLSEYAGVEIELVPARNFIGYWSQMRKPGAYDFLLDGAHLAAYRLKKMDHQLLAKVTGVLSFTLITRPDDLVLDPEELVNRRVAVLASPNLGGLQVYNLFSNPAHQPLMVEVKNALDALEAVRDGRADAAYVPTPILARFPEATVVASSEQMPNMTLTASKNVPAEISRAVAEAVIKASTTDAGRVMLEQINIDSFELAQREDYDGLENILQGMWGY